MFRPVLNIMKGSALAQVVGFLILPLLSRSFGPEIFGQYQVYQAVITMFIVVVMFRYEIAILRAGEGRELTEVLALCSLLILVTTFVPFGTANLNASFGNVAPGVHVVSVMVRSTPCTSTTCTRIGRGSLSSSHNVAR